MFNYNYVKGVLCVFVGGGVAVKAYRQGPLYLNRVTSRPHLASVTLY